jgi:hypothetical protein
MMCHMKYMTCPFSMQWELRYEPIKYTQITSSNKGDLWSIRKQMIRDKIKNQNIKKDQTVQILQEKLVKLMIQ